MHKHKVLLALRELLVGLAILSFAAAAVSGPLPAECASGEAVAYDHELADIAAPLVARACLEYTDLREMGVRDPWDPICSAFAASVRNAAVQGAWDRAPDTTASVAAKVTLE